MNKHFYVLSFIFSCILFSCEKKEDISTHIVERKNFENIIVIDGLVEPLRSTNVICPRGGSGGTIAFLLEEGTAVEEGDLVCVIENQNLESWYDQQVTNLENSKTNLEKLKADLAMQYALLDAEVKSNEAETQIANLDSLQLQYYSPSQRKIKEIELKKVAISRNKFQKKLDALAIIQRTDLRKQEIEIQNLTNQAESVKKDLDALTLKAPKKGLVTRGVNWSTGKKYEKGDQCWFNSVVIAVPEMDKMKVMIEAPETEYRYISVNDSVSFIFDALPNNVAWGKIINKMPVGKEYKKGSKVKLFTIEASIDSTSTIPDPGFTALCYTYLKEIKDTITVPQIAIFEQDSMRVVYVETKKGYEVRQVETAESSPKETIVTKGLVAGERVALRKPSEPSITKTILLSKNTIKNDTIPSTNILENETN